MTDERAPSTGAPAADDPAAEGRAALAGLWAVQQVDTRLAGARDRLAALDDGSRLRAEVEVARAAAADAAARLHQAQAALRDHELQLRTTEDKQKKAEGDLYGGRVSNPKELASLQEETGALARTRDHLEDQILGLFEQVEALTGEVDRARRAAGALEAQLAAHLAEFEAARSRLDAEIAALAAERAALGARVDGRVLRKYEGIAAQEAGVGIVAVLGDFCGGCHNTVPAEFVSRIRHGRLVTCERCHRILYLDGAA